MKDVMKNKSRNSQGSTQGKPAATTSTSKTMDYKADLDRMRQKATELGSGSDSMGLVMADALIRGMRDIGYKNTAFALFELVDNGIQAGAQRIMIDLATAKGGPDVTDIAVVDDGHGMPREWLRYAIRWGGTHRDRIQDRTGFGRYGYGMKSSCISYGRSLHVISKTEDSKDWSQTRLDLDEIAAGKFRDDKGNLVAPEPQPGQIPDWVVKSITVRFGQFDHGTAVVVSKIDLDRLTYSKAPRLKEFLLQQLGITYRNFLRTVDIYVGETKVEPIDPLFTTKGFKFHDEDEDRAEALPPLVLDVKTADKKEVAGQIRVRFSFMPPTFLRTPEDKQKPDGRGAKQNARFKVRKEHNGIIVLRAGRQIDVVTSKCPWFGFQNNDRYVGTEVDFDPVLDEEFHITTSKQQVVLSDRMWDILEVNGVKDAINDLRARWAKDSKTFAKTVEDERKVGTDKLRPSEEAMKLAEKYCPAPPETVTQQQAKTGEKNLEDEAKKTAKETGIPVDTVRKQFQFEAQGRPYKVAFEDIPGGVFYRIQQFGGQKRLFINRSHRFYTELYGHEHTSAHARYGLEALLFVLGTGELTSKKEIQTFYQTECSRWSSMLHVALARLGEWDGAEDAEQADQDLAEVAAVDPSGRA
jgi:Histidine kinase-, DNA gyrase B-, and HSP90-like ATPase